jgi:hypothetical protein
MNLPRQPAWGRSGEETSALRSNGTPFGNRFKRRASTTLTDSELRDGAQCKDGFFDERYVADLKSIAAGSATEAEILQSPSLSTRQIQRH